MFKDIPLFRPIVSSIGTYNYNLSKYLCRLLTPHIPSEHCAMDTFSFVHDIQDVPMYGKFLVSFDVESLLQTYLWRSALTWQLSISSRETPISN